MKRIETFAIEPTIAFECASVDEQRRVMAFLDNLGADYYSREIAPDSGRAVVIVHGGDAADVQAAIASQSN